MSSELGIERGYSYGFWWVKTVTGAQVVPRPNDSKLLPTRELSRTTKTVSAP